MDCLQAVKDCLWAFATLEHEPSTAFLETSVVHCERMLSSFTSQNVANAMWAYNKLGFRPSDRLLAAVDEQASCSTCIMFGNENMRFES